MRLLTVVATLGLGLAVLAGCGEEEDGAAQEGAAAAGTATTDIGDLLSDPARFEGQEITVTGDVEGAPRLPNAFALSEQLSERDIVVLPLAQAGDVAEVVSNERVTVRGRVVPADEVPDDTELALRDGSDPEEVLEDIGASHALLAERVEPAEG